MVGEEVLLPCYSSLYALLDDPRYPLWYRRADDRAGIVGSLEQAGYGSEAVVADPFRCRFQPRVPGDRLAEGLPPGSLLAFTGEFHEMFALRVIDLIQLTQVADVPRAGAALARLKSAHLGRTDHEALGDLFGCPALPDPECPEQRSKLATADRWAAT